MFLPEVSCPVPSAPSLLPWAVNQGGRGCWGTLVPPTSLLDLPPRAPYLLQGFHLSSLSLSNASLWAAFCSLIMMFFSTVTWPQKPIRHRSGSILAEPGPHGEEIGRCPARGGVCAARAPTPSQEIRVPINPPTQRGQGSGTHTPRRLLGSQLLAGGRARLSHPPAPRAAAVQPPRGEYVSVGGTAVPVPPICQPLPPFPGMVAAKAGAGDAAGLGEEAGVVCGPPLPVPGSGRGDGGSAEHGQQSEASP